MAISVVIPVAKVIRKPQVPLKIGFEYPREYDAAIELLLDHIREIKTDSLRVEISKVKRPRSTGRGSQNNHVWGHCTDIAAQLDDYNENEIEEAMKRMAVSEGYPTKMSVDGAEVPKPFRDASIEEAKILLDVIHRFADIHNLYLTENDDEGEYQSIGGRNREEMRSYVRP